jgi:single-strand DNA-binding protein
MLNLNKIFIAGNLVAEPRTAATQQGAIVCNFRLAVNRKTNAGEDVCYFDVTAWGKLAEACGRYLHKGDAAFVEGYMRQESWTDARTGGNRSKLVVIAESVQFMSSPRQRQTEDDAAPYPPPQVYTRQPSQQPPAPAPTPGQPGEDLPF